MFQQRHLSLCRSLHNGCCSAGLLVSITSAESRENSRAKVTPGGPSLLRSPSPHALTRTLFSDWLSFLRILKYRLSRDYPIWSCVLLECLLNLLFFPLGPFLFLGWGRHLTVETCSRKVFESHLPFQRRLVDVEKVSKACDENKPRLDPCELPASQDDCSVQRFTGAVTLGCTSPSAVLLWTGPIVSIVTTPSQGLVWLYVKTVKTHVDAVMFSVRRSLSNCLLQESPVSDVHSRWQALFLFFFWEKKTEGTSVYICYDINNDGEIYLKVC